jgi:hypothetical protein
MNNRWSKASGQRATVERIASPVLKIKRKTGLKVWVRRVQRDVTLKRPQETGPERHS